MKRQFKNLSKTAQIPSKFTSFINVSFTIVSKFRFRYLVDLAGSERQTSVSMPGKDRVDEAKYINQSLTALGKVVMAFRRQDKFVPYRDSLLTRMLKKCFSTNAKALVIAQVTLFMKDIPETACTLQFASRAARVIMDRVGQRDDGSETERRRRRRATIPSSISTF